MKKMILSSLIVSSIIASSSMNALAEASKDDGSTIRNSVETNSSPALISSSDFSSFNDVSPQVVKPPEGGTIVSTASITTNQSSVSSKWIKITDSSTQIKVTNTARYGTTLIAKIMYPYAGFPDTVIKKFEVSSNETLLKNVSLSPGTYYLKLEQLSTAPYLASGSGYITE